MKVLTKTRKDLKRPTTTYSEQETTWSDPQRVRHNLQWPENTYIEQRKDTKRPITSRSWGYFTIWGKRFSSLANTFSTQHLVAVSRALLHEESWWKQSVKHLLSCIRRQLSCAFFTGYKIYFFLSGFRVSRERKRLIFLFSLYHFHSLLSESFNDEVGLRKRIQEQYYIFYYQNLYKSK